MTTPEATKVRVELRKKETVSGRDVLEFHRSSVPEVSPETPNRGSETTKNLRINENTKKFLEFYSTSSPSAEVQ